MQNYDQGYYPQQPYQNVPDSGYNSGYNSNVQPQNMPLTNQLVPSNNTAGNGYYQAQGQNVSNYQQGQPQNLPSNSFYAQPPHGNYGQQ